MPETPETSAPAGGSCEAPAPRRQRRRRVRLSARRRISRQLRSLAVPVLALGFVAVAIAATAWQAGLFKTRPAPVFALGEQYDGDPLSARHPLAQHHNRLLTVSVAASAAAATSAAAPATDLLALRRSCVWGKPGGNPYRGSVEQALRSAALPEEVVQSVVAQVRAGQPVDRLEIRNGGVKALASGRVYDAKNIAMTYGNTLCLATRVNFVAGHMEPAALYEAMTKTGHVVAVMVPEVCGNVSVLGQAVDANRLLTYTGGVGGEPIRWMPAVLDGERGALRGLAGTSSQDVPEPGTLACVLAALAGLFWCRRKVLRAP